MNIRDPHSKVFLIDDDESVRVALARALRLAGFVVQPYESADAFLAEHDPSQPGCLVADVTLPGTGGLELQRLLSSSGVSRPIVFITGHGNIRMSVQAMRAGAVTFLPKPVRIAELATAIDEALERDRRTREQRAAQEDVERRLAALTHREREVLDLVVVGKLNKQIAAELGAAEKTVKVHRGRVMCKMRCRSVAELVTLAAAAGVTRRSPPNSP